MKVAPVKENNAAKVGKKIGTTAGFAGYIANVALKEGKDIFAKAGKEAVAQGLSPKVGVAVKTGSIAVIATGCAVAGRLIGGAIGKLVDRHNEKKAFEKTLKTVIEEEIKNSDYETMKVE